MSCASTAPSSVESENDVKEDNSPAHSMRELPIILHRPRLASPGGGPNIDHLSPNARYEYTQLAALRARPAEIKAEMQLLARILEMPLLAQAVEPPAKREPMPSMTADMRRLFEASQTQVQARRGSDPLAPDVVLQLRDRALRCHSAVLRARSPFFAAFFDDEVWTVNRWDEDGVVTVDLGHLSWRVIEFVVRFLCCGDDSEMFETLGAHRSTGMFHRCRICSRHDLDRSCRYSR